MLLIFQTTDNYILVLVLCSSNTYIYLYIYPVLYYMGMAQYESVFFRVYDVKGGTNAFLQGQPENCGSGR